MGARAYQNTLKKIRNRCNKFGVTDIDITKIDEKTLLIQCAKWNDSIQLDIEMGKNIILTGYFRLENNLDLDSLTINTTEKIRVNNRILNRNYGKLGVMNFLVISSLVGGIIVLSMSLILYLMSANTVGYVNYTYQGNFAGNNVLNWFHMLLIGLFLIGTNFFSRYLRNLED